MSSFFADQSLARLASSSIPSRTSLLILHTSVSHTPRSSPCLRISVGGAPTFSQIAFGFFVLTSVPCGSDKARKVVIFFYVVRFCSPLSQSTPVRKLPMFFLLSLIIQPESTAAAARSLCNLPAKIEYTSAMERRGLIPPDSARVKIINPLLF